MLPLPDPTDYTPPPPTSSAPAPIFQIQSCDNGEIPTPRNADLPSAPSRPAPIGPIGPIGPIPTPAAPSSDLRPPSSEPKDPAALITAAESLHWQHQPVTWSNGRKALFHTIRGTNGLAETLARDAYVFLYLATQPYSVWLTPRPATTEDGRPALDRPLFHDPAALRAHCLEWIDTLPNDESTMGDAIDLMLTTFGYGSATQAIPVPDPDAPETTTTPGE